MTNLEGVPIIVLKEGTERTRGKAAQNNNVAVAKALADAVRTTLGPKGMDKMLVDELGDITVTNDGATILNEMNVEHPVAKMLVEVAKTQDEETGDGTTTAVVLAGEFLKEAIDLIEQEVHPTVVIKGYRMAVKKAVELLRKHAIKVSVEDKKMLETIATVSITGKAAEKFRGQIAQIVVKAITSVAEKRGEETIVDLDDIKVEKKEGGDITDTKLVDGIIIDKERVHSNMPQKIENTKIALINSALEVRETETDAEISITNPDQLQAFLDQEEQMLKDQVQQIVKSGANVVLCQKGIDDIAQHYLAQAGLFAVRRVKKSDMDKLAKATGAKIITRIEDINPKLLGTAKIVEEVKIGGEEMTFIRGCKHPKSVSILLRGGTQHVIEEAERALHDAICAVASAVEESHVVTGGGSIEEELSQRLKDYAKTIGGREQLAIEAFAKALEIVPKTLAESAGMNAIDTIVQLRSGHEKQGGETIGINVYKGRVEDMKKLNVFEPLKVKKQAISSAGEVAEMILRIDDVIAGTKESGPEMPPGPEDMGDM